MFARNPNESTVLRHVLDGRAPELAILMQRLDRLSGVQNTLRGELPPPLRDHLLVAGIDEHTLLLLTDSAAWAARLRFQTQRLLQAAREQCGLSVRSIKVKVFANFESAPPAARRARIPARSAEFLRNCAEAESDPELRNVLLRLSLHV